MPRSIDVRRSLALTGAFVLVTWGAAALPASAMDPATGNGNGSSHAEQKQDHDKKSDDKSDQSKGKGHQGGDTSDQSKGQDDKGGTSDQSGDQSHANNGGNKGGNGKGQGPKSPNPGNGGGSDDSGTQGDKGGKGGDKGDPAGNNGTVKITPIGEDDGTPQNTPHVVCGFDIEWYGFDEGEDIVSTVEFAAQAPTSDAVISGTDPAQVFVGGDPATGAGTDTGFDGEQTYYLGFTGEPHPKQGYHVKLTIHTPGSQGADTKHKVFWVEPCTDEVAGTTDETDEDTETEGTTDEDTSSTEETEDSTTVLGAQAGADTQSDDTEVMGAQATLAGTTLAGQATTSQDVPSAVDAGEEGNPVVGFVTSPLPLLVIGLGALLAGAAVATRRRSNA